MTTTDPFITAAHEESQIRYHRVTGTSFGAAIPAFKAGAEWARTHLAAQEPTDAECIAVLNAVTAAFGERPRSTEWASFAIQRCREAMVSARAARRDEEKRDG